jgi:hypothetical protein
MVVKFRNTIWPPPPQLSLHRRAALGHIGTYEKIVAGYRVQLHYKILYIYTFKT